MVVLNTVLSAAALARDNDSTCEKKTKNVDRYVVYGRLGRELAS